VDAIRFPTDNSLDIPALDPDLQADRCRLPLHAWGTHSRRRQAPGAWHFYTEDYRFSRVWKVPLMVVDTNPTWVCELNPSIADDAPIAEVIHIVYRKRWVTRFWQSHGLAVAVDLNVPPRFQALNLSGVPRGWLTYSTRAKATELGVLETEYQIAAKHAGTFPLFIVVGGGEAANQLCRQLPGAVWIAGGQWQ